MHFYVLGLASEGVMDLKKMLAVKDKATPKTGFNLVELDAFARPSEELTVLAHYTTRSEAERAMADYKKANPGVQVAIFGANDK
jgi:hypothetical protein